MKQIVKMHNIKKSFGTTQALLGVDFTLNNGEILSLLGENGAGKTTLMKILYGMIQPDEGNIEFDGKFVKLTCPTDAINLGIGMVHQHFMLVPAFTVAENIIVGNEPRKGVFVNNRHAMKEIKKLIDKFHFNLDPNALVSTLSVGEQQRVEILKALFRDARVLILDEPSAVLAPSEVDDLFVMLNQLRKQDKSIVIITHKLYETMTIADRVVVLRDGKLIHSNVIPSQSNVEELSNMMVGRPIKLDVKRPAKNIGEISLKVKDLVVHDRGIEKVRGISFEIRKGEIYGFAGIEGNGQTQILNALTGLIRPEQAQITLNGKELKGDANEFLNRKVGHVPEDRSTMGLVLPLSIRENLILGYHDSPSMQKKGFLKKYYIEEFSKKCIQAFQVKTSSPELPVRALSGGNQQKVIIARVLSQDVELLIIAHPTRGLDIGSAEYMHEQILRFRDEGKAVLLVSADLDEVYTLSDRLAVLYDGRIVVECVPEEFTKVQLGLLMTGSPLESVKRGVS
ncbi:MAG: ABC transporter ATP-binding protein [Acetivibrionales bacterium]|jgi:ABC-type uncharacterized transport system ATPase subunit